MIKFRYNPQDILLIAIYSFRQRGVENVIESDLFQSIKRFQERHELGYKFVTDNFSVKMDGDLVELSSRSLIYRYQHTGDDSSKYACCKLSDKGLEDVLDKVIKLSEDVFDNLEGAVVTQLQEMKK